MVAVWDGTRLRKVREGNEQSLADVAQALGVWPFTVMRWESNRSEPRLKYRRKLEAIYPDLTLPEWTATP